MKREFLSLPHPYRVNEEGIFNEVFYKFNNYGFRCDDFIDCSKHKFRLLFVGGSTTEGMGLNVEDCWAKDFHQKVCNSLNYDMPYWNISIASGSIDHIARYLYCVGDLIKPQIIVSWLPPIERRERYDSDFFLPTYNFENKNETKIFINDRFVAYQTEKNFAFINFMLEKWNSLFLYRASHSIDEERYDFGFRNMVNVKGIPDINIKNDYALDCRHAGSKTNKLFSETMFEYCWPIMQKKFLDTL